MRHKKWAVVFDLMVMNSLLITLITIVSLVAACATPTPEVIKEVVTQVVEVEKEVTKEVTVEVAEGTPVVERSYAIVPPDLCPPGIKCEGQLRFDDPTPKPYAGKQVTEVWVQHGLFYNVQGELFRMNVIGVNSEAVELYTKEVRVCLDQILTDQVTAGKPPESDFDRLPEEFGANPNDLIIEVYLYGVFDPQSTSGEDIINQLLEFSAQEWGGRLKDMGFTPKQARPEQFEQDWVVGFVIDPNVEDGGTHYYPQRSAMRAYADVSVADGGGSVEANLYRDAEGVDETTVRFPGKPVSDTLSYPNGGTRATYNLAVKGNLSGRYLLSGQTGYDADRASWVYGYDSDPPPCVKEKDKCLQPFRGKPYTHTIDVTTPETPIPKVDILLLFDVTGSMEEEIEKVKENAFFIMEAVVEKVPDAAFGVASFADYPYYYDDAGIHADYGASDDYPWSLDLDIQTDTEAVQWALDGLELRSGGDDPECYSRALSEASNVSWRSGAKKVIVLFGDSTPHDARFFQAEFGKNTGVDPGEDKKAGTEDDLVFTEVVGWLKETGIEVIPVNSAPDDEMVAASFDYLAKETGGQVFNIDSATEAPEAVVQGLESATARIKQLIVAPDPTVSSWVTATPIYYDVGGLESCPFEVTITVPEDIEPVYEFNLTALADGATLQVFHVVLDVQR